MRRGFLWFLASIGAFCAHASSAEAAPPPAGDLVGHWTFDEGSGNTAADSSTYGHTLTLVNGAGFAAGKFGQALSLPSPNASGARAQCASTAALDMGSGDSFTISAWIKTTVAGSWKRIATKRGGASQWYSMAVNAGKLRLEVAAAYLTVDSASSVNDGQWRHVAAVRDRSQSKVFLYVDGSPDGSADDPSGALSNAEIFEIGYWDSEAYDGTNYSGLIDDVRVYKRALAASEVAELAQGQVRTWVGGTDTSWGTAANWSPAGTPASADLVRIQAGSGPSVVDSAVTIRSLTLPSGFADVVTVNAALTITENLVITSGTLAVGVAPGSLAVDGAVTVDGGTLRGSITGAGGAVTLTSGGTLKGNVALGRQVVVGSGGRISPGD